MFQGISNFFNKDKDSNKDKEKEPIEAEVSNPDATEEPPSPRDAAVINIHELNEKQQKAMQQIREQVSQLTLTETQRSFCSNDHCLRRYLQARDFNVAKALDMLKGSLKWREEYNPEYIDIEQMRYEGHTGKMYIMGADKQSRPIVYMKPANQNTTDYAGQVRLLVWTIEKAISIMNDNRTEEQIEKQPIEQMDWIMDLSGYSSKTAPPFATSKQMLDILLSHYPERMGVCFMVDAPTVFHMFFKLVSPFLTKRTRSKIVFVNGNAEQKRATIAKHVNTDQLEKDYGGDSEFVFTQEYWETQVQEEIQRQKRNNTYKEPSGTTNADNNNNTDNNTAN